jgi:AraC-like DNA-binding protein
VDRATVDRVRVASRDVGEARAVGGSAYFPHRLSCRGDRSEFAMRLRSLTIGPLMAGVLSYDVEVHIETTHELATAYEVNVPLGGDMDCWVGGRHTPGSPNRAVVNGPGTTSTLHGFGPGNPLLGLKVNREALETQYQVLHGRPPEGPIALRPGIELDRVPGRQWWALARMLLDAIDSPDGLLANPMVARPLVDSILRGLLTVAGDDPEQFGHGSTGTGSLRAAIDFLRAHASEPVTVSEIAAAARCSVRALQEAFRRHLGTSPMAYLERTRLAGAHADLIAADPGVETVNEVCWRWGFTHAGRFAAAYRRHYGVPPSETLRAI